MSEPTTLPEALSVIRLIRRQIGEFAVICAIEEETDTDEVWQLLADWVVLLGGRLDTNPQNKEWGELVHQMKTEEASGINNDGIRGQLEYLRESLIGEEYLAYLEGRAAEWAH